MNDIFLLVSEAKSLILLFKVVWLGVLQTNDTLPAVYKVIFKKQLCFDKTVTGFLLDFEEGPNKIKFDVFVTFNVEFVNSFLQESFFEVLICIQFAF